ncbi:hypothetical protein Tco_0566853 [Tanacetum coccineum]
MSPIRDPKDGELCLSGAKTRGNTDGGQQRKLTVQIGKRSVQAGYFDRGADIVGGRNVKEKNGDSASSDSSRFRALAAGAVRKGMRVKIPDIPGGERGRGLKAQDRVGRRVPETSALGPEIICGKS